MLMAVATLVHSPATSARRQSLPLLRVLAARQPGTSLSVLPLLLFQLNREEDPENRLSICSMLPYLATSPAAAGALNKAVSSLSQAAPLLRSLHVRLLCGIWRQQDRSFPQLISVLTASVMRDSGGSSAGTDDGGQERLACAAAIREVLLLSVLRVSAAGLGYESSSHHVLILHGGKHDFCVRACLLHAGRGALLPKRYVNMVRSCMVRKWFR